MESVKRKIQQNPREHTNLISVLFFWWTVDLFKKGFKQDLSQDDLFEPLSKDKSQHLGDKLEKNWQHELKASEKTGHSPNLLKVIFMTYKREIIQLGVFQFFIELLVRMTQPYFLGQLLTYFQPGSETTKETAYLYAGALAACVFLNVFTQHFILQAFHLGMRIRVAFCSLLYRKSLRLSRAALGETATGKVVNLLSNDVARFDLVFLMFHSLWLGPLVTVAIAYIIWQEAGVPGLVGVIVVLLVLPTQAYLARLTAKYRLQTAYKTDERVRLMDEIITGVRVIKMYAWERPFASMIRWARKYEINIIRRTSYLRGISMSLYLCISRITIFSVMVSLVLLGEPLTSNKVFMYAAYLNVISFLVTNLFVRAITEAAETLVSVRRLKDFLLQEELDDTRRLTHTTTERTFNPYPVILKSVTARWKANSTGSTLQDINLRAKQGKLIAIIGPVGSGKSSLLQVLLGELTVSEGTCAVEGSLSYACQEPWVFGSTIRQNIVFGSTFNKRRYDEVVRVCALRRDLEGFPQGDLTQVGERGSSLSGGQKARINLARAVYNEADVYLLDDPLSAVDTHVGRHLFDECINSYLKKKTRILVTHQLQYLKDADYIILINNGVIEMQGKFDELLASDVDYAQLLGGGDDGQLDAGKGFGAEADEKTQQLPKLLRQISRASTKSKASTVPDDVEEPEETEVQQQLFEASSKGKSERSVYAEYFCSGANCLGLFLMSSFFIVAQAAASGADYWMSFWVTQEELRSYYQSPEFQYDLNTTKNNASAKESEIFLLPVEDLLSTQLCLYIYTGIVVFLIVIAFVRSFTFYTVCMRSSVSLHNDMFNSVIRTPVRFFDVNPSGRVLNRFAKDIGSVDELLPKSLMDASQTMFIMLGSLVVGVTVNYWFIIPILLLGTVLLIMRSIYLRTSKNVKRVEGITKSPVFTHMNATLQGLSTIRAYGAQKILQQEFDKHQDVHSSAFYMFITTSSAFGFFIDFICFIYISLVTFSFLVLQEMYGGSVGLAITQAMALAGVVQFGIRQTAEVANNMMSVERVAEYKYLQEEPNLESNKDAKPPEDWPFEGEIEFQNVYLKYVETEPPVLKDLNLVINPGEKVGIVGRTGAGKSSLISALFRLSRVEGTLKIDGVDTSLIGLEDLRSRISIIPQDPFLFSGTLRRNLDPFSEFDDDDLWRALEEVELKETYKEGQGLSMGVTDGGGNVSVGQRQLICLARAILRNNKILLLDEATANVDPQTDELIQKTIRSKFVKCTVLTVAHRLHTIMDSNKVLVMDSGKMIVPIFGVGIVESNFGKTSLSPPDQDSNLNITVIGGLVYC
uniref:Uncharacterized protein n=1 Tax=Timema poppense TaxID=170557 RepID=A0A7R9GX95_TIMPO|nr:unnamed protein product [Timema poppensis]